MERGLAGWLFRSGAGGRQGISTGPYKGVAGHSGRGGRKEARAGGLGTGSFFHMDSISPKELV